MGDTGIPLGFEVPSGTPVTVPLGHTIVTGLTQRSGKTTCVQALIARSDQRAIAFATKRGEIDFPDAAVHAPYYVESVDWRYVESILEAAMRERMRFERSWIMQACRGAKTLAQVQANVKRALRTAKGLSESVYITLDHYLDLVVPQLAQQRFATTLALRPGLNVMELGAMSDELQALVIRATIERVMEREHTTSVVIPECWNFLPQRRGGPVKLAAERLIREGAVLGNYLVGDSQDLSGVDKLFLKGCRVWLLGCQTERNEVEHTLDQVPLPRSHRPLAAAIMSLPVGHFYGCWDGTVRKVYVRPTWMEEAQAQAIARGVAEGIRVLGLQPPRREPLVRREEPSMCQEHQVLAVRVKELEGQLKAAEELGARADELVAQASGLERRVRAMERDQETLALLRRAFSALGLGNGAGPAIDEAALVERVVARVGTGGGPVTVTAPDKLRRDFQEEEVARLVAWAKGLTALQKKVLKLLESTEGGFYTQTTIATRLGRSTEGGSRVDLGTAIKNLGDAVQVDGKRGVAKRLREKIAGDLAFYKATPEEVEQVYATVLYQLATEGES